MQEEVVVILKKKLCGASAGCLRAVVSKRAGRNLLQTRLLSVETDGGACSGRGKRT